MRGWPILSKIYGGYIQHSGQRVGAYCPDQSGSKIVFALPKELPIKHKLMIISTCMAGRYNGTLHGNKNVQHITESEVKFKIALAYFLTIGTILLIVQIFSALFS